MPLYEYKCTKCGMVFEVLQKVTDPPIKECTRCHGAVKKIISPPSLQFKGSGWYITDYAGKNRKGPDSEPKEKPKKEKEESSKEKKPPKISSEKK